MSKLLSVSRTMPERCQDCRTECVLTRKRCANPTIRCHRKMDKQDKDETCLQTPSAPSTSHHNLTDHNKGCCTPCTPRRGNQNNEPEQNNTPITFMLCCARGVAKFPASLSSRGLSLSSPENNAPQKTLDHQELQWVLGENHAEERNGRKPQKKRNEEKHSERSRNSSVFGLRPID